MVRLRDPAGALSALAALIGLSVCSPDAGATALPIVVDGVFDDWGAEAPVHTDPSGDNGADVVDFGRLWVANDADRLLLRIEVGAEIEFQEGNGVVCYIDGDNDAGTGLAIGGIGAEFHFEFGNRSGTAYDAGGSVAGTANWFPFGLRTEPTTTGTEFELAFERASVVAGVTLFPGSTVAILFRNEVGGVQDVLPDAGTVTYTFDESPVPPYQTIPLGKIHPDHVRVVSHNTLSNGLTDPSRTASYQRITQALVPDILCYQEVGGVTADEASQQVASFLGGAWDAAKNSDTITVSRWPIADSGPVNGNLWTLIDLPASPYASDLAVINAHLPCCSAEGPRQDEVDAIMALIRDMITPGGVTDLPAGTPIILTGDMNFVGFRQQLDTMLTGDIQDTGTHGPAFDPDWDGTALTDVFPLHTSTGEVYTWRSDGSTFAPGRLDFLIYQDSVVDVGRNFVLWTPTMSSAELTASGLQANDVPDAADHNPVVVDLIPPGAAIPAGVTILGSQ